MSLLVGMCLFTIGNIVFKLDIAIPMGIDPAPYWTNFFLYFLVRNNYIKQFISNVSSKTYKIHGISRFIDNLCEINDGNEFLTSSKKIFPTKLQCRAIIFLHLDIKSEDNTFVSNSLTNEINFHSL